MLGNLKQRLADRQKAQSVCAAGVHACKLCAGKVHACKVCVDTWGAAWEAADESDTPGTRQACRDRNIALCRSVCADGPVCTHTLGCMLAFMVQGRAGQGDAWVCQQ